MFSGAGGLDTGFAGHYDTRLALDYDLQAVRTYRFNHPRVDCLRRDLAELSSTQVLDVWRALNPDQRPVGVIGGPPCQAFSFSNVHKRTDDPRAALPFRYAAILKTFEDEFGLDFFVFENVKGLTSSRHAGEFGDFKALFEASGFDIHEKTLDAQFYGVAQTRPRVFIVGISRRFRVRGTPFPFRFPSATTPSPMTVEQAIGGLPEPLEFRRGSVRSEIPFHPNHVCMKPRSDKFARGVFEPGQMLGRSFRVLAWDKPSWTVAYGHREMHIHPNCRRRVSVYEGMLLQGFPERYELLGTLTDQIRMVSDAVPPPLAEQISSAIYGQLHRRHLMLFEDRSDYDAEPPAVASAAR